MDNEQILEEKILDRFEKNDDHWENNKNVQEKKYKLVFEKIKEIVLQYKQEENITFEDLSKNIPNYENINYLEDPALLQYTDMITHNEETIQTCTKYTKYKKARHVRNLRNIIKRTNTTDYNKELYLKHPNFV